MDRSFSNNFFTQKTKLHKYALPSIFLRENKQTSINNVRPAEQIENSTITENPTVENLILPVMPKAQNRHPTKSSSVLQVLECKKVTFTEPQSFWYRKKRGVSEMNTFRA
ncbi:hypothetical protein MTP99_018629 [Tenebrio molitor]|nr:hypothetical protein MTP99_018629 [Tenebrio molitor]